VKITKYAQSTFRIELGSGRIVLVDPGKYNTDRGVSPSELAANVDLLIITHEHSDHFDLDLTRQVVQEASPLILASSVVHETLTGIGIPSKCGTAGEVHDLAGVRVELIRTDHVVRDEEIINFGFVLFDGEARIYHTSDTRFIDSKVLGTHTVVSPDVLLLPIGNRGVVMGFDDALVFADALTPRMIVPMHYDSPKDIARIKPEQFIDRFSQVSSELPGLSECSIHPLDIGQSVTI
jgi:L-ascorbate metabolism protein UlaG (beta-lactamase superfamily)